MQMGKIFNISADCKPNLHYMINIVPKLERIKDMVDKGQYFTINRGRQYGKTTTLRALGQLLEKDYVVVSLDFQMMSYADLYNLFLTASEVQGSDIYRAALQDRNRFIGNGRLDMKLVLEKFVVHFDSLYGDRAQEFLEEDGRRYFLLYLRPIINGVGNYYIESRTRNMERTDVIVDYRGEQFVVEMKTWHGNTYHARGEAQLSAYLDYYHLKKGYMLSFCFNQNKQIGVKEIALGDKLLVEAVV